MRSEVTRLVVVREQEKLVARVFAVRHGRPVEIHSQEIAAFERAKGVSANRRYPDGWDLYLHVGETTDASAPPETHRIVMDGGCGCGSPLKNFTPPGDLRMSAIVLWPTEPFGA